MKKDNFLLYVLLGVGALGAWYWYKNRNKKQDLTIADINAEVTQPEAIQFPAPFLADYNIVMPSDLVNKSVREKAAQLTAGRYEIQNDKIQDPLFI